MLTVHDVSTSSPFYTVSASDHLHHPGLGVHPGRRREPQGISPSHTGGLAKNRTPFHLATLELTQPPGVQQAGGRVHQGIARHGRLAKDRAPYLIRRNEPSTGALSSNTILRFEKTPTRTILFSHSKDVPYALRGSFIGILGGTFGLVFADRPGHRGSFAFQSAAELLASMSPRVRCTPSSLNILESRLGLLHDQGSRQFDQVFTGHGTRIIGL